MKCKFAGVIELGGADGGRPRKPIFGIGTANSARCRPATGFLLLLKLAAKRLGDLVRLPIREEIRRPEMSAQR